MNWKDVTLFQFQQMEAYNEDPLIDDVEKTLLSVCSVFNMTPWEFDNAGAEKALKLANKLERLVKQPFQPTARRRVGRYRLEYQVEKLNAGQLIELFFFMQRATANAHYILASISRPMIGKGNHKKRAEFFRRQPVAAVYGALKLILEHMAAFNKEYESLYDKSGEPSQSAFAVQFNRRYGWTYSATQVKEYEGITLEKVFEMPARQFLNDLVYLKARAKMDLELSKTKSNGGQ